MTLNERFRVLKDQRVAAAQPSSRGPVRHGGLALNPETVPDHDPAGLTVHDSKGWPYAGHDSGFAGSLEKRR